MRLIGEHDDVDVVIVPQRVQNIVDDVPRDLLPHPGHAPGSVEQDEHVLGTRRRLDVPAPGATVEEVHRLGLPSDGRVLPHESSGAAEVLPRQRRVQLVVVDEGLVQDFGPLDGLQDLLRALPDVRWDVDRRHAHVHSATEVGVVGQVYRVVLRVHEARSVLEVALALPGDVVVGGG